MAHRILLILSALFLIACGSKELPPKVVPPSILLITLDTTRADRMGWERDQAGTPHLDELASSGRVFHRAFTPAPMTLPSHASLLTGLYPAEHHVHENARYLGVHVPIMGEELGKQGYQTAAFVSAWPLAREFGTARGFDHFDDKVSDVTNERDATATTEAALTFLNAAGEDRPLFLWVHYFDPHDPYAAPPEWQAKFPDDPYQAEIAFMDSELGRLVSAFKTRQNSRIAVVGDHGEGLGDHGEAQHGNLIYSSVARVPLILNGAGIEPGKIDDPVSTRRIYHTLLDWAGISGAESLMNDFDEVVLSEALKPWLQFGWAPQIAAVHKNLRVIRGAGDEVFDLDADPNEANNLAVERPVPENIKLALDAYPLPTWHSQTGVSDESRERLASLGYASSSALTSQTEGLPDPKEMVHLFADMDRASDLFVQRRYKEVAPLFEKLLVEDSQNPMLCIRLAVTRSLLDQNDQALKWFRKAGQIAPDSVDLHHYLGMHYFRTKAYEKAAEKFEWVLQRMPDKTMAQELLGKIRMSQKQTDQAIELLENAAIRAGDRDDLLRLLGDLYMEKRNSKMAVTALRKALDLNPEGFDRFLELGVCLMDIGDHPGAGAMFDRVSQDHPGYAMALFKRAQVSVLTGEPDARQRIDAAASSGDPRILQLIENEPLFRRVQ